MELGKDLVAASATPLVLAIVAEGESYGYAILKRVAELSGGHLQWTDGMLYPVLHRLERQGLVAGRWGKAETGRRSAGTRLLRRDRTPDNVRRRGTATARRRSKAATAAAPTATTEAKTPASNTTAS